MAKTKSNHLTKLMQYLFAYNTFEQKLEAIREKQKDLLLRSIKQAETQKADIVRKKINESY